MAAQRKMAPNTIQPKKKKEKEEEEGNLIIFIKIFVI